MSAMASTHPLQTSSQATSVGRPHRAKYLCIAGFCGSLSLGLLSGVGGLALGLMWWLGLVGQGLRTGGTLMIMAAFPMFMLATHYLEKASLLNKEKTAVQGSDKRLIGRHSPERSSLHNVRKRNYSFES